MNWIAYIILERVGTRLYHSVSTSGKNGNMDTIWNSYDNYWLCNRTKMNNVSASGGGKQKMKWKINTRLLLNSVAIFFKRHGWSVGRVLVGTWIVSTKKDLAHVFSRFQEILEYLSWICALNFFISHTFQCKCYISIACTRDFIMYALGPFSRETIPHVYGHLELILYAFDNQFSLHDNPPSVCTFTSEQW